MSLKYGVFFSALIFLFSSCAKIEKFPSLKSEKIESEVVRLNLPFVNADNDSVNNIVSGSASINTLDQLFSFSKLYLEKDELFDLNKYESLWSSYYTAMYESKYLTSVNEKWLKSTGLLLEITGKAIYAEELQRISNSSEASSVHIAEVLIPYIFTKYLDNVFVNIFSNASLEYTHTTRGEVKIEMLTNYPKSNKIDLKFNMTERRYIEVNIRIPEWAEGATVTVKRVKYFAPPGGYCKITKKWKEGDLVEIEFPKDKMPVL